MADQTPRPATGRRSNSLTVVAISVIVAFVAGGGITYFALGNRAAEPAAEGAAETAAAPAAVDLAANGEVVARVNGKAITEKDLENASSDFSEELARVPEDQRREALIQALVDLTLVAQEAEKAGLDKNPDFARRIDLLRTRALRSEFVRAKVAPQATDEAVRKRFDEEIGKLEQPEEIKASHILVETEDEAKAIIEELKAGGDFAAIAKEKSKDPGSGANGGDLGYFGKGSMVEEFETVAFALETGQFTQAPVKSQFGFHIIRLEDRRKQPLPQFEAVQAQVSQLVMSDIYVEMLQKLKGTATIEIIKPSGPPAGESGEPMDANPLPDESVPPSP